MKKILLSVFILSLFSLVRAQSPQSMNYQAVARDSGGSYLVFRYVHLRFTIHDGSASGNIEYQETDSTVTNQFGLFTVAVGAGDPGTGNFSSIAWDSSSKYLQVEIDITGGTNYADMGTTQLLSVPYALSAGNSYWALTGNNISSSNAGRVGIGTSVPLARFQVADSSVLFSATGNVPVTASGVPISGSGRRMMWYADKAAFRSGYVLGNQWDEDSIGNFSFATGINTEAKGGNGATALGNGTSASGQNGAIAFGYGASASGSYGATAMGNLTTATGANGATAMGNATHATGDNGSTAMGQYSVASGTYGATAIGFNTTASGDFGATSIGYLAQAIGTTSFSIGWETASVGTYSTSLNSYTISNSYAELVAGQYNDTSGAQNSTAWVATDRLFEIGNGTSNSLRSNAVTVLKNGNTGIGTSTPTSLLELDGGDVYINSSTSGVIMKDSNNACWRLTVSTSGSAVFTAITCP